jgi:hypothetical protein
LHARVRQRNWQFDATKGIVMLMLRIARDVLENFWKRHGLSAQWEEDAIYQVTTGFGFVVWLTVDKEAGLIRLWTTLHPEVPDERREAVHALLLEANLGDRLVSGGSLALNPESMEVVYQHAYNLQQGAPEGFSRFFALFTEAASGLKAAVGAAMAGALEAEARV